MRLFHSIFALSIWLVTVSGIAAQEASTLPKVVQHAEPIYPAIARTAHIEGEVLVRITTDGKSVTDAKAESGPPMLWKAAEDNARTWKFSGPAPETFQVTFRYRILSGNVEVAFLQSPGFVDVAAPAPEMIVDYAWIGLGDWTAQLKSLHGESQQVFKFSYSGPHGDWLAGTAVSPKGGTEEIDFGRREGDFLAFTLKLRQPDGQRVKVFLVGRMAARTIIGTFVDEAGITGEWTATRNR